MGSIKATVSAIDLFKCNCENGYNGIFQIAKEVLADVRGILELVEEEHKKISQQIWHLLGMRDNVKTKLDTYESKRNEAKEEVDRWQEEIDYLKSHPTIIKYTDEEGNEKSEEVYDDEAISEAQSNKSEAKKVYDVYAEKYSAANNVFIEIEKTRKKFEATQKGIEEIRRAIQNNIYEINKNINSIEFESEHNIKSLQGVLDSLNDYLESKPICMPSNTVLVDYASSSNNNTTNSINNSNSEKLFNESVFKKGRVETMDTAFDNSPSWIIENIKSLSAETKVVETNTEKKHGKKVGGFIRPKERVIYIEKSLNNEQYLEAFRHEFGHFVDFSNGTISEQTEFSQALASTRERLNVKEIDSADNTIELTSKLSGNESVVKNIHLQDLFSAVYAEDNGFIENTLQSGAGFLAVHDNDYYLEDHNDANEIFANLFAIYSSGDQEVISFVEENLYELTIAFKNALGE